MLCLSFCHTGISTFFVIAFGSVPNCGASGGRSTGLLMSEGTDSVLRIFVTETHMKLLEKHVCHDWCSYIWATNKIDLLGRKEILQDGASLVHLLWHFNLQVEKMTHECVMFTFKLVGKTFYFYFYKKSLHSDRMIFLTILQ